MYLVDRKRRKKEKATDREQNVEQSIVFSFNFFDFNFWMEIVLAGKEGISNQPQFHPTTREKYSAFASLSSFLTPFQSKRISD
jgi:hypothetical protein